MPPGERSRGLARRGWESDFPRFRDTEAKVIRVELERFVRDASREQVRAWDESIPLLQGEVGEVCEADARATTYSAILEYELPLESRRPDVVLLVRGAIVVLELKGKTAPTQADLDQASAYARDLRCYHRACEGRPVHAVVVPTRAAGYAGVRDGVHVAGPDALDGLVRQLQPDWSSRELTASEFLAENAYRPLPTLVQAARELFTSGTLRRIDRANAATDPAAQEIARIIREAARTRTRRLVLLTGVPGAGKTLVGLRVVHAHFLDDLSVERPEGKPTAPAVFLSGNGPLVEVLQHELSKAGGGGKTFVRGVKDYVKKYGGKRHLVPPEQVLVFDEAQRAWDRERVAGKHDHAGARSEPEHFIEFAERIPDWCVVIGLIGSGQEIHVGEEGGLVQWREAVEHCSEPQAWSVHGPAGALRCFEGSSVPCVTEAALDLDTEIRFHRATALPAFVAGLLEHGDRVGENARLAAELAEATYNLRISRSLEEARDYLRGRYEDDPEARFGIIASSRDRDLVQFGIGNDFQATKRLRVGPWYGDPEASASSCRRLTDVATEFQTQGLELDGALLAWGTDLLRVNHRWSADHARGYQRGSLVRSPFQLRVNAYRVLLTRARDGVVVFLPPLPALDETYAYLVASGFKTLA